MMNNYSMNTMNRYAAAYGAGYRAAVYCRLSKDDDLEGESAGISSQRELLWMTITGSLKMRRTQTTQKEMSLFMTALYERTQNMAAPILAHAVWNIAGAIILGGVSLADDYPGLFTMTSVGNVLISGGDYKIEGSIIVLALNILSALFFWPGSGRKGKISN